MDWNSLIGLVVAILALLLGQAAEGGHMSSLVQPAAFIVVFFGTLGAVLVQTTPANFMQGLRLLPWVFSPVADDREELIKKMSAWSIIARKEGLLSLEAEMEAEQDLFIKRNIRLVIDGMTAEDIQDIVGTDLFQYEQKQRNSAKIWDAAGGYAPTLGILGAVLGLVHVMENLSDPSRLGGGIAVAFIATIYGVALANLVFLPIGTKLKVLIGKEVMRREMILSACLSITKGEHPEIVKERLNSYMQ